ncbi:MAG: hypothetical protein FJ317_08150 [SAR202 cluster bacterium]|nr:hypothetical protein [SAR202 cluster bacterium]
MPAFTTQQRSTVDAALAFLERLIDCYNNLPAADKTIPDDRVQEIQRVVDSLQDMNANGRIDFQSAGYAVLAYADRNGIHLNSNFGNDYRNDYTLPDDYNLDDCDNARFYDLWRLIEILFHEHFHYERHSGVAGSFRKLGIVLSYATVGNALEGLSSLFTSRPRLRRRYSGHEHQAYGYCQHMLFWLGSMLTAVWLDQDVRDPCIPCPYEHIQRARSASERQDPYEWVR